MRKIVLFVEDKCHEDFICALVRRIANDHSIQITVIPRSARGGFAKAIEELKRFLRDIGHGRESHPDLLIVATDSNCRGRSTRSKQVELVTREYAMPAIQAIPDPHVERWLLQDSGAFKKVFGRGCDAPDAKCAKDRYKMLFRNAVKASGMPAPLGGWEYVEDLAMAIDLDHIHDTSLEDFVAELGKTMRRWRSN